MFNRAACAVGGLSAAAAAAAALAKFAECSGNTEAGEEAHGLGQHKHNKEHDSFWTSFGQGRFALSPLLHTRMRRCIGTISNLHVGWQIECFSNVKLSIRKCVKRVFIYLFSLSLLLPSIKSILTQPLHLPPHWLHLDTMQSCRLGIQRSRCTRQL